MRAGLKYYIEVSVSMHCCYHVKHWTNTLALNRLGQVCFQGEIHTFLWILKEWALEILNCTTLDESKAEEELQENGWHSINQWSPNPSGQSRLSLK